ncbi:MAG: flavodoxin domain-containing protein [Spirochaetales bacterium]|nr:flavodoxin domain-containing protein [Spirochaetales bacterium]
MILVTYATTHGSTREVAQAVGTELRAKHLQVEVADCKNIRDLESCDAVILGAPLYMFRLHGHARRFLSRNQNALQSVPVAMFALGPFHDVEKEWNEARGQLDKELAKYPWFKPVSVELFGGKFDPANMRMPYKLIPALKQMGEGDIRDWDAIRAWAAGLPRLLKPGSEQSP